MKKGDLIKDHNDGELGIIMQQRIESTSNRTRQPGFEIWWIKSNCFGWYPGRCLEIVNESR